MIRNPTSKSHTARRRVRVNPDRADTGSRPTLPERFIYIVDADRDNRLHLARFLRNHGFQTEAFGCGTDFIEALAYVAPGCALISNDMASGCGVELIPLAREARPEMISIMMAFGPTVREAIRALKLGAVDVLELPIDEDRASAILDPVFLALPAHVARECRRSEALTLIRALSSRERDVFHAIVEGATNREISSSLAISERTVEMHRANLMRKVGLNSVAALTRFAVMSGIMESDQA